MSTSTKVVIDPEVRELELFLDSRKLSNIGYMIILEATLCFKQVVRCLFLQLFCIVLFWNRVYNKIFEILGGWRGGSVWQRVGGGKEKGEGATSKKCDKSIRYPCLKTVCLDLVHILFIWMMENYFAGRHRAGSLYDRHPLHHCPGGVCKGGFGVSIHHKHFDSELCWVYSQIISLKIKWNWQ